MLYKEFDAATTPIEGRMLLEASAGTGKTYSLMRVLLRLLVEKGIELDRILVVTFTNAATDELSSRLRSNLTELIEQIRLNKSGSFNDLLDSWGEKKYSQDIILEKLQTALNKICASAKLSTSSVSVTNPSGLCLFFKGKLRL